MPVASLKDLICRWFSVPAPDIPLGKVQDLHDENYEVDGIEIAAGDDIVRTTEPDLGPVEVIIGTPVATINRPSRSWSAQGFGFPASSQGRIIQLLPKNPFRTRARITLTPGLATGVTQIRLGTSQGMVSLGAGIALQAVGSGLGAPSGTVSIEYTCADEIWAIVETGEGGEIGVMSEYEDGS